MLPTPPAKLAPPMMAMAMTHNCQPNPTAWSAASVALMTNMPARAEHMLTKTKHKVLTRLVLIPETCAALLFPPVAERMGPSFDRRIRKSPTSNQYKIEHKGPGQLAEHARRDHQGKKGYQVNHIEPLALQNDEGDTGHEKPVLRVAKKEGMPIFRVIKLLSSPTRTAAMRAPSDALPFWPPGDR